MRLRLVRSDSTFPRFGVSLIFVALTVVGGVSFHQRIRISLSVAVNGNGKASSKPSGINCPHTCVASFPKGTSVVLYQSSSGSFIGWSGACSSTGSCSLTMNSDQFAAAAFGQGSHGHTKQNGVWSPTNQQPVTRAFYPGTIWTTPLPADAGSHLWNNSDAIITHIFGRSDVPSYKSFTLQCLTPAQCTSSFDNGFYYASASDPVFRINTGSGPCPGAPANCAAGKYFHLPSGATWDSVSGDQGLMVWDQSTDIDPTPGGRIISSYYSSGGPRSLPANCTAKTPAQADAQPACQLGWYYNSVNFPFGDPTAIGDGMSSDGSPNGATFLREQEIMQGTIGHALGLETACLRSSSGNGVADPPVFPATGNAIGCSFADSLRPLNGSLFWIDSAYDCSVLPAWQAPVCKAMQTYGGYMHATQGGSESPLFVMPIEGGMAHTTARTKDGYFNDWIIQHGVTGCPSGGYPKVCTGANGLEVVEDSATTSEKIILYFFQMPGLITGHHLHIVDPCIPKRLAGQPGTCP
jgi:hypothetical protein